jgi:hypothetical protein
MEYGQGHQLLEYQFPKADGNQSVIKPLVKQMDYFPIEKLQSISPNP